jgi:hypothetical protein
MARVLQNIQDWRLQQKISPLTGEAAKRFIEAQDLQVGIFNFAPGYEHKVTLFNRALLELVFFADAEARVRPVPRVPMALQWVNPAKRALHDCAPEEIYDKLVILSPGMAAMQRQLHQEMLGLIAYDASVVSQGKNHSELVAIGAATLFFCEQGTEFTLER